MVNFAFEFVPVTVSDDNGLVIVAPEIAPWALIAVPPEGVYVAAVVAAVTIVMWPSPFAVSAPTYAGVVVVPTVWERYDATPAVTVTEPIVPVVASTSRVGRATGLPLVPIPTPPVHVAEVIVLPTSAPPAVNEPWLPIVPETVTAAASKVEAALPVVIAPEAPT